MHANRSGDNLLRDFGISENFSCLPAFLIHILRSFLSRRLFPSRDRAPLELSGSTPPRLILPACIQVEAAVEQASARARRILREIFGRNSALAMRMLPQTRKLCGRQYCLRYF